MNPSATQDVGLQAAVRLVGEGQFVEALSAARAEPDPLGRVQAELYVLHQGGALEEALRAGLGGLETGPNDVWLLGQSGYIALSLGIGGLAEGIYLRLEEESTPEQFASSEVLLSEARDMQERRKAETRALSRARSVVLASFLSLVLTMCFVASRPNVASE